MLHAAAGVCRLAEDVAAAPVSGGEAIGRIVVHRHIAAAMEAWAALEAEAAISPYQTSAWHRAWLETRGRAIGIEPLIVVAHDRHGLPLALLPFGLQRRGILTIATFLGERDSNFNLGLFRPDVRWTPQAIESLLRTAARSSGARIDLFVLHNQPRSWEGIDNPLAPLSRQPSPSFGYKVALQRDPDRFFKATLSKDGRKKLRRKAEKLAAIGPVEHRVARTPGEAVAIIEAFERQRLARCAMMGLSAADVPDQIAFLKRASLAGTSDAPVEMHALYCGSRILATFGGTTLRGRFCGMVISFDATSELARFSPGDLLVAAVVRDKCRAGITVFDLGIGEARYKDAYCPEPEPLFETLLALSALGKLVALAEALRLRAKRSIKQSAWAWPMARRLRRGLRRLLMRPTA